MENETTPRTISKEDAQKMYEMTRAILLLLLFNFADIAFLNNIMYSHGQDFLFSIGSAVVCGVFLWTSPLWLKNQMNLIRWIIAALFEMLILSNFVSPEFCKSFAVIGFSLLLLVPLAWFIILTVVIVRQHKTF